MKRIIGFFADNGLLINIISVGLLLSGIMFIVSAKREAFPNINFDYVVSNTIYPGASAADVEKHVTIEIEDQLREVDGIEEITSSSIEARSIVVVKLDPDLPNRDKVINDIKSAIDRINDFPEDVEDPVVTEIGTNQRPIIDISLFNKGGIHNDAEEFELRKYAKILEDRIIDLPGVARIDKQGYRDREMIVEINPALLDVYQVGVNEVVTALAKKNLNFPGGVIKAPTGEVMIRTIGEVETADELRRVLIRANDLGNWVSVGDVATVKDSFEEESIINNTLGKKSVAITVLKKESADIIDLVDQILHEISRFKKLLPDNFEIVTNNDLSYYVRRRLNVLSNNAIVGSLLVVISLLLALGWRISLVTALGLPLAFCGTFIWMAYYGISINLMSMFGLIVVLGMLVDDAIVVAENVYRHLEDGMPVREAVINGTHEVIVPVAGTIMTTIAAFAPLMFMSGIMGKFMWTLPAVVSVALVFSWVESMLILPSHILEIEKRRKHDTIASGHKDGLLEFFRSRYVSILAVVLRFRYLFAFILFLFFVGTIIFARFNTKFILFPQSGIETVVVKAESPTGTSVARMSENLNLIEQIIAKLPKSELESYTSRAGIMSEGANDPNTKRGAEYGIILVYLTPEGQRERKADEIMDEIRKKTKKYLEQKVFDTLEYKYIRHGPPVGSPVAVQIKGNDFEVLKKIAAQYKKYLSGIKGLKDIKDNFEEGKDEIRVFVDERTAAIAGITVADVANTLRTCFEGTVATEIKKTDEEIDIRVRFPLHLRKNIDTLRNVKISNKTGNLVPFSRVTRIEKTKGISVINRRMWRRTITVSAEIDEHAKDVTSSRVNLKLIHDFRDIEDKYPGYTVSYEGEFKDTQESQQNLSRSFIIAALVIYIILVALFRSLLHPLVIMGVIPLTILGVIWTFFFHGLPLSFLAIMGLVGLTGVIVNDSIVYVDFIKKARLKGLARLEATLEAGRNRLRPIFLTTITTFFGLIPTAYGIGGNDPFLKPMAISMSWGLIFGTIITLFGTPVLYNILTDIRRLFLREKMEGVERDPLSEKIGETIQQIRGKVRRK
ncbi:MAG TPA: efflux RND transporter permease subunit [Spirochaetota bacterium]|nr:efflux RND transporter permease subunit [Spirochaetota bacterium]